MKNGYVDLESLGNAFQQIVGNKFKLAVNNSVDLEEQRYPLVMYATRNPYKIDNINSETLDLAFETRIEVNTQEEMFDAIAALNRLIGLNKGEIVEGGHTFRFYSQLDFSRPLTPPEVDEAQFVQNLYITGSCLIARDDGALIGNEVSVNLTFNRGTEGEISSDIEVLEARTNLICDAKSPQMANTDQASSISGSIGYNYVYTALIMKKNSAHLRLLKALLGKEPLGLNEEVYLTETWPEFEFEQSCILTEGAVVKNRGAFVIVEFTLNKRLDDSLLDVEDEEDDTIIEDDTTEGGDSGVDNDYSTQV